MLTLDKASLEHRDYRTFSQDKHTPVVTASNVELAYDIIRHVTCTTHSVETSIHREVIGKE